MSVKFNLKKIQSEVNVFLKMETKVNSKKFFPRIFYPNFSKTEPSALYFGACRYQNFPPNSQVGGERSLLSLTLGEGYCPPSLNLFGFRGLLSWSPSGTCLVINLIWWLPYIESLGGKMFHSTMFLLDMTM